MSEVASIDWLDLHSSRTAQDHAVRLSLACSAVLPSDKNYQRLIDEQITADIVGLAIHGRRAMERRCVKSASLTSDPIWPASSVIPPKGINLWDAFGAIIHAVEITIGWEQADLQPNPYSGRIARFAGNVRVKSDDKEICLPIGGLVSSFFFGFLNKTEA